MLLTRVINAYIISVDTNKLVGYIVISSYNIIQCARASNEYNNIHRMNINIFKINRSKNEISTHSFESSLETEIDMDEAKTNKHNEEYQLKYS